MAGITMGFSVMRLWDSIFPALFFGSNPIEISKNEQQYEKHEN